MKQSRLRLENDAEVFECGGFILWGCSPHAPGNMGCCIPSDALPGIKKVQKKLKNSLKCLGNWCRGFWMWSLCFVGLLAPRPRQHGMLHPKLRLTAQEKAIEKENTATHFQAQRLFSVSKLYQHCAKRTVGVALPLPGRGGGISPHIQKSLRCFLKGIGSVS